MYPRRSVGAAKIFELWSFGQATGASNWFVEIALGNLYGFGQHLQVNLIVEWANPPREELTENRVSAW